MDGEQLIEKMHANPALADTPIAVLSGRGTNTPVHGVSAHLVKPVEIGELLSVVQKLSRRSPSAA